MNLERHFIVAFQPNFLRASQSFFSMLVIFLLTLSILLAQEGYLNLSLRNRSQIFGSSENYYLGNSFLYENEYENIWHLDLFQKTFNFGYFHGWFDGRLLASSLQAAHWYLSWQDFKTGPLSFGLHLGDYNFQFTTLGFRFSNYYPAFNYHRGLMAKLSSKKFGLNFFSGRVAKLSGLMGLVYSLTEQTSTGFLAHFKPNDRYYFGFGFLYRDNEKDWTGKLLTSSHYLLLMESEIKLNERIKFGVESKTSLAKIEDKPEQTAGHSFRVGPFFNFDRGTLEVNYRRVEADFRGVRSDFTLDQDQEGLFISWRYQPRSGFYLFNTLDYYHDKVGKTKAKNPTDYFQSYAGFSLISSPWPYINCRLEFRRAESRYSDEDYQHFLSPGFYLELSKQFDRFDPYLRLRYRHHDDRVNESLDFNLPSVYLGLRYSYSRSAYFLIEMENSRYYDYLEKMTWSLNRWRFIHYSPFLLGTEVYSEIAFSDHKTWNHLTYSSKQIEFYLGFQKELPWRINLRFDFRSSWHLTSKRPANYWITLRMDRRFDWGQVSSYQGKVPGLTITGIGKIEGLIYSDQNLNGQFDLEDKALSDISFFLEDGSQAFSDQNGKFIFSRVPEGLHSVSLNFRNIPADYYLLCAESQSLVVEKRKTSRVEFRLVEAATMGGQVFQDLNKNGLLDEADILMKDILILLKAVSTEKLPESTREIIPHELTAYTDETGQFIFENILPGVYELNVDQDTLPKGVKIQIELPLKIDLKPGQKIKNLLIKCLPRPIIYINNGKEDRRDIKFK
ncbi:MAG: hypothetical protein N3B16_05445 [Candidatus Aminicenantes bacterium]|nr:hypothetical protein [Candidatus Aminicenantes bacterium]